MVGNRAFSLGNAGVDRAVEHPWPKMTGGNQGAGSAAIQVKCCGCAEVLRNFSQFGHGDAFAITGLAAINHNEPYNLAGGIEGYSGTGMAFTGRIASNGWLAGFEKDQTAGQALGAIGRADADNNCGTCFGLVAKHATSGIALSIYLAIRHTEPINVDPVSRLRVEIERMIDVEWLEETAVNGDQSLIFGGKSAGGLSCGFVRTLWLAGGNQQAEAGLLQINPDDVDEQGAWLIQRLSVVDDAVRQNGSIVAATRAQQPRRSQQNKRQANEQQQ